MCSSTFEHFIRVPPIDILRLKHWYKKYGSDDFTIIGVTKFIGTGRKENDENRGIGILKGLQRKVKLPYSFAVSKGHVEGQVLSMA